jgi:hypothetical protein
LWGAGTGAFGGASGAASQWLGSPATRFAVGVGLPSAVGAGATYLQTGDLGQSVQAGALSLTVGALGSHQQAEPTAAQQRAFQLGRQFRSTSRAYLGAAMLGVANVGPSLRLSESPSSVTVAAPVSEQVTQAEPAPATQQAAPRTPPPPQQQAPSVRISAGAFIPDPARQVVDPFSGEVLGQRSASAQTARSVITGPRADEAEAAGWRGALSRGEIGLQAPLGANVSGGDFYTAQIDATGQVTLVATDVKSSTVGRFPTPATTLKPTWMAELQAAIAPGRLNLGDPPLENAIRAAFAAGRVRIRQINADYSPAGGGDITGY